MTAPSVVQTAPAAPVTTEPVAVVPAPAPQLIIFMRCTENRVEDDYDGGVVLFQVIAGQNQTDIIDGRVVLSVRHDEFMRRYPVTRDDKQGRFFKVTLEEVPFSAVPPDPNAPKPVSAFDLIVQARDAAKAAGDEETVQKLDVALGSGIVPQPPAVAPTP